MKTTVIGSYPKPSYLKIPDWFSSYGEIGFVNKTNYLRKNAEQEALETNINKAIEEIIIEQKELNIDIITDGEVRRENYIYSLCRNFHGIDFENLTENIMRLGAYKIDCPTIVSKVLPKNGIYHSDEWWISNKIAEKHNKVLKFTLPGPMTICDSFSNTYYNNEYELCSDFC